MLDIGLYIFYVLLAIAVLASILFPIVNAIKTPGSLVKSAIGVIALVVLFGIAYALSGSDVSPKNLALGVNEGTSKLIGAGLIMFYFTLVLSVLALIYSEISKTFR